MRLLRLPAVREKTGLSRSSIYNKIKNREFPHAVSIGARAVAWDEAAIDAWIISKIGGTK